MADKAPADKGSKEATFTALAADFKLDDKVRGLFLGGPMETLEDFCYYFADEKEIDAFVATEESLKGPAQKIQIARVRRAWAAVRQNGWCKENRNTISSVAESDGLLEEGTLREVRVQFWKRYKAKYPVEVNPSDQLLSSCYREMEKRLLTVYDIWKVKTLRHQVMTTKKRKQVGTDLYTFEDEIEVKPDTRGVEKYLVRLHTYLLALAIAGSSKVRGAPGEEAFGNDSTKFVKVPWDVLQLYHFRASRAVMSVPEVSRLTWLEERDIAERSAWVARYREGDETLGQVVQAVMEKSGAHWDAPSQNMAPRPSTPLQPQRPKEVQTPMKQKHGQQEGPGKWKDVPPISSRTPNKMQPGTIATALRDGTVLCQDFNKNKCDIKGSSCSKGAHKCAKVDPKGRPCGMPSHGAHNCREWNRSRWRKWHDRWRKCQLSPDGEKLEATQTESSVPSEVTTGSGQGSEPCKMDIISGPDYPLAKDFELAGWCIVAVDCLLGDEHDLSKHGNWVTIRGRLQRADCNWAALGGCDKSRIEGLQREHTSSNTTPTPLSSEGLPGDLPGLQGHDEERVAAAEFILGRLRLHQSGGGTSGRENPANNLHWHTPTEVGTLKQDTWWHAQARYLVALGRKKQRICHDVEEIRLWPDMRCSHRHRPQRQTSQVCEDGETWYPSGKEAEYTACLVFHIVYSVSIRPCQEGGAKLAIPRRLPVKYTGDRTLRLSGEVHRGLHATLRLLGIG